MSEDVERVRLRRFVAEQHDLDWKAANVLIGETVEELDASARALRRLIDERREADRPVDLITAAKIATAERKHQLGLLLSGRMQPRDAAGRYAPSAGFNFDGGARQPAPTKGPPEIEHDRTLLEALRTGESDVGAAL
jgi:hypothetical protein